jgi:Cu/Ag efflux protein CusF
VKKALDKIFREYPPEPRKPKGHDKMKPRTLFASLIALALATAASAQPPAPVTKSAVQTLTATIVAIDSTNRLISLKADNGAVETIVAGPDMQRFNELKVGDKVTFKYYESVVFAIQKPGATPPSAEKLAVERNAAGSRPGGKMTQTQTAVVTVTAIDMAIPSVTIRTDKGGTMHFKVEDKGNLTGVKVGDKVQVTYTEALAISVESPKK